MKKTRITKGVPQRLKDEWKERMNNSNQKKLSTGAQEAFTTQTVAHKEQWRGVNRARRKAK